MGKKWIYAVALQHALPYLRLFVIIPYDLLLMEIRNRTSGLFKKAIIKKSKQRSMELLFEGETQAAIMPKAVGLYLAGKMGLKVRILDMVDSGSPVAMAVKKGNRQLLERIDRILKGLIKKGEIDRLYARWFKQESDQGQKVQPPVK